MSNADEILVRHAGLWDYPSAYNAMVAYTQSRDSSSYDEIWCLEHPSVYTLGMAGKPEHILTNENIPVVKTDRGGQVTYHGEGQLVTYLLIDLNRKKVTIKRFVNLIEQAIIDCCAEFNIRAERRTGAPGVYVNCKKIAALGIRVRRGCSYHGLSLNVDMDLVPFRNINPCGYPGLEVTSMLEEGVTQTVLQVFEKLLPHLMVQMDYQSFTVIKNTDPENNNSIEQSHSS